MTNTTANPTIDVERLRRIVEIAETEHAALLRVDEKLRDLRAKLVDAERRLAHVVDHGGRTTTGDSRAELDRRAEAADAATEARRARAEAEVAALRAALVRARSAREAAAERHGEASTLSRSCVAFAERRRALPADLRDDADRVAVRA